MERVLRVELAYVGSGFAGSQVQPTQRTVQGELEAAWHQVASVTERFTLAGRTDAGVHAERQVASVRTAHTGDPSEIAGRLRERLPSDIALLSVSEAAPDFDARASAVWREYRYRLPASGAPVFGRWLDRERMARAAAWLVGERDFAAVSSEAPLGPRGAVRRISKLDLTGGRGELDLVVRADAFLRQMVRRLVSALVFVGTGKIGARELMRAIEMRDRKLLPGPAPAEHLTLVAVGYGDRAL